MMGPWWAGGELEEETKETPFDNDACRVRAITDGVLECLMPKPVRCRYAMPFGHGFFCQYLKRKKIVADTRQLKG